MSGTAVFWMILSLLFLLAAIAAAGYAFSLKKRIRRLTESINAFSANGTLTDFSTADDEAAALQNSISDLQQQLVREKENTRVSAKKNASFIADISHQLKTPLAGLRLYCEMQNAEHPTPHTEKQIQLIEKMEDLIFSLLRLEKIRADAYSMDFAEQNLHELFRDILHDMKHLFPEKRFLSEISETECFRCDRSWLSEAFGNVLKNACEHTLPQGEIRIEAAEENQVLTVSIEDDGGGVQEEELCQLFTRFHRTENAAPGSAGIGLSITKAIVEKHHGTVSAVNGQKGLRIVMCFPITEGNLKI